VDEDVNPIGVKNRRDGGYRCCGSTGKRFLQCYGQACSWVSDHVRSSDRL